MRGRKPEMKQEPNPLGYQPAPDWFGADAVAEWERVMPILEERRILTDADLGSLENYCVCVGQVRECERLLQQHGSVFEDDGKLIRNPAVGVQSDAMTRARLLAAELGLTPVSRSRPAIREDDTDDFAELDG